MSFKKMSAGTIIVLSFLTVILVGTVLLYLPFSRTNGAELSLLDAFYISASAVCVTGLSPVAIGATFNAFGETILALLIQIGGMGITVISVLLFMALGKKIDLKNYNVIKATLNFNSGKGVLSFVKAVFITTICFELIGTAVNFVVFIKDYPFLRALGISAFHAISSFNNAGFDIFLYNDSLSFYKDNILLNLNTCFLIISGGLGFLVIREMISKKLKWKRYSLHAKVVISTTLFLLIIATVIIKLNENISWHGAFFTSVTLRTAGFYTYSIQNFSLTTKLAMCAFMLIGASPGSTGGGIKTTTFFVMLTGIRDIGRNKQGQAFHYGISRDAFQKASVINILSMTLIIAATYLLICFNPALSLMEALFEATSSFGTVGLSLNVTPILSPMSKIVSIVTMFIGRLGPLTIASLGFKKKNDNVMFPEGNIPIG